MTNYLDLKIEEINKLLKDKKIKPIDLVNEAYDKIEKSNLNAFITLNKENAIKKAIELENKEVDNLLFGLPIAIKDNIVTKNIKTTCASRMLEDFIPIYDATVIKKINDANMIIIGKTNMDEFAMGSTGETSYFGNILNPYDNTLTPGGSSSGSAAVVSASLVPLSLGSDTGGSIRQPSSFCGVVGMKPTYGKVSRYGLVAFASSLDVIGPITRNVYENALLLNVIEGADELDLTTCDNKIDNTRLIGSDISSLKIAVPNYYMSEIINNEVRDGVTKIINLLKNKGCQVEYIDIPYLEHAVPLYQVIALAEASSNLARYDGIKYGYRTSNYNTLDEMYKNTRSEGFGSEVKRRIMIGSYVLSGKNANVYYKKALKLRNMLTNEIKKVFENYDLMIGPVNTNVAYKLGIKQDDALKSFYDDILTIPFNMSGNPSLSLPIGINSNKLPIGMQIIGDYYNEDKIYCLASYIEKELNLNLKPGGDI